MSDHSSEKSGKEKATLFDRRFRLYEKLNVSLNTMNIVVTVVAVLLIAAVIIGVVTANPG